MSRNRKTSAREKMPVVLTVTVSLVIVNLSFLFFLPVPAFVTVFGIGFVCGTLCALAVTGRHLHKCRHNLSWPPEPIPLSPKERSRHVNLP